MNEIKIFNNPQFGEVRTINKSGEVYFVGNDIAKVLGYSYPANAIQDHVDDEDKTIIQLSDIQDVDKTPHLKGSKITVINESGVYSLVFGSKLELAKQFKKWITSEVLPAIRKTGGYIVAKEEDTPELIMARALMVAKEAIDRQAQRLEHQEQVLKLQEHTIKEQAPKVEYFDSVLDSKRLIAINVIANDLGITAIKLNRFLLENKVIYKVNGCFVLCAKYRNQDLAHTKTYRYTDSHGNIQTAEHLYWTEKGREMIIRMYQQFKKAS